MLCPKLAGICVSLRLCEVSAALYVLVTLTQKGCLVGKDDEWESTCPSGFQDICPPGSSWAAVSWLGTMFP